MKNHKDLEVWRKSISLARDVYRVTAGFPDTERYGLTTQMRRAAVSIASNIAEGAARRTDKEFIHFLYTSAGSASELDTQIEICLLVQEQQVEELKTIQRELDQISRMIQGLIRSIRTR